MSNFKYCNETTKSHGLAKSYSNCIELLSNVSENEGAKSNPFSDEECLNMDKVENILARKEKRDARKTMDISFGVADGKNKCYVLCEYRLNYNNPNNLSKSELDAKLSNTKNLLGTELTIHKFYYFVFAHNIKQQAIHSLRRLYQNKSNMVALELADLKDIFFT